MKAQWHASAATFHEGSVRAVPTSAIVRYLTQPARLAFLLEEQLPSAEVDRVIALLEAELDRRVPA